MHPRNILEYLWNCSREPMCDWLLDNRSDDDYKYSYNPEQHILIVVLSLEK